VPDHGHVFGAVAGSEARLVLVEDDVEDPVEAIFDPPMAAHGVGGGFGGEGGGGDIVSGVEAAVILEFGTRRDLDDGGDGGQAQFAGEAPVAIEPLDLADDGDGALLDAAVALVEIGEGVETGGRRAQAAVLDTDIS
jgi:hypothetical protein